MSNTTFNYSSSNFISIPAPGQPLDAHIKIYDKNGVFKFSIEPYTTNFNQKSRYVYIIVTNNIVYEKTMDFANPQDAQIALAKLDEVKEIYLNNNNCDNNLDNYYTKTESNNLFYTKQQLDDLLDSITGLTSTYTGDSDIDIGGIEDTDVFNNTSNQDMWYKLLHPYQIPYVVLSTNISSSIRELGDEIEYNTFTSGDANFGWNTQHDSNVIPYSLTLQGPLNKDSIREVDINSLNTDGNLNTPVSILKTNYPVITSPTSLSFTIKGTNTKNNIFSDTITFQWKYRRYWGTYSNTSLPNTGGVISDTTIQTLLNQGWEREFCDDRLKEWTQNGNGEYIYYLYPKDFGDNNVPFIIGGLPNNSWIRTELKVQFENGYDQNDYYVYRSEYIQNGSGINIKKI